VHQHSLPLQCFVSTGLEGSGWGIPLEVPTHVHGLLPVRRGHKSSMHKHQIHLQCMIFLLTAPRCLVFCQMQPSCLVSVGRVTMACWTEHCPRPFRWGLKGTKLNSGSKKFSLRKKHSILLDFKYRHDSLMYSAHFLGKHQWYTWFLGQLQNITVPPYNTHGCPLTSAQWLIL
jgi:hypothetical protein